MRHTFVYYLCIIVAIVLQACNNDIFIDKEESPENINVTVDGDYGEVSVPVRTKNLVCMAFDGLETSPNLVYYDADGREISKDSPFSEIAKIVYTSYWLNFEIKVGKESLTVNTFGNSSRHQWNIVIRLEYSYTSSFVHVLIEEGKEPEIVDVTYDEDIHPAGIRYSTHKLNYINNTENHSTINVAERQLSYIVDPESDWAEYRKVNIRLPEYSESGWHYGKAYDVKLSITGYITLDNPPESVPVEIPPNTSLKITNIVTYEEAVATGVILFRNPVTKQEYPCAYKATVSMPVENNVSVDELR